MTSCLTAPLVASRAAPAWQPPRGGPGARAPRRVLARAEVGEISESPAPRGRAGSKPRPEPMMGIEPPRRGLAEHLAALPAWSYPLLGLGTVMVTARVLRKVKRALTGSGSLGTVRDRGLGYEDGSEYDDEYFRKIMKRVNKKPVEAISDDQIRAARERRRVELQEERVNLEEIQIPKVSRRGRARGGPGGPGPRRRGRRPSPRRWGATPRAPPLPAGAPVGVPGEGDGRGEGGDRAAVEEPAGEGRPQRGDEPPRDAGAGSGAGARGELTGWVRGPR